jgi:hypothetical protein
MIERHLGGSHVPNRIQVTCTASSSHNHDRHRLESTTVSNCSSDVPSDFSSDYSDISESEPNSTKTRVLEFHAGSSDPCNEPAALSEIMQDTWSGQRPRCDDSDYGSDTTEDDSPDHNATLPHQNNG